MKEFNEMADWVNNYMKENNCNLEDALREYRFQHLDEFELEL